MRSKSAMRGRRPAASDRLDLGLAPSSQAVFAGRKGAAKAFAAGIGDNPLKNLGSWKKVGLDFVPKNLDFVPGDLDILHRVGLEKNCIEPV